MEKIILYYKYVDIENPQEILAQQRRLCEELNLKGRIIIAQEGINGTLGGSKEAVDQYQAMMQEHPLFGNIDFKESDGSAQHFPRLRIVIKDEIVRLGISPQELSYKDTGKHLSPDEIHALLTENPQDLVILDTRNDYESAIGAFNNALKPAIKTFREFPEYIDNNIEQFNNKKVLMYCTGGVRCERATAYLKQKNVAQEVYQIQGGIHRYIEQYPDGYFRGKNYVFDGRIAVQVNNDILSTCLTCQKPADTYNNCLNAQCNKHYTSCPECLTAYTFTCSTACKDLVESGQVKKRNILCAEQSAANAGCL